MMFRNKAEKLIEIMRSEEAEIGPFMLRHGEPAIPTFGDATS